MAKPFDFGEIKLTAGGDGAQGVPDRETPFCIALLGDFSGRSSRSKSGANIGSRRAVLIDRDNFDQVLARFGVEIHLPLGESERLRLRFSELDDFHPDHLLGAEVFRRLRDVRGRLEDPATFAATASELGIGEEKAAQSRPEASQSTRAVAPDPSQLTSGSLLDAMIEQTEGRASAVCSSRAPDELQEFVRRVTEPQLVARADPRQEEVLAVIDRALGSQMRALLHVPEFQALEAAWRAVFLLVRRIETNTQLKIHLIDVSKAELADDLASAQDLRATGIYRLLVEKTVNTPGGEPWAVITGNYTFGPEHEDAELLGRMAKVASAAGAPLVAAASPRVLGCPSIAATPHPRDWRLAPDPDGAEAWAAVRALREASSVGLALPRFLLRLPYGKKTDQVESFDFEEMLPTSSHEDYLWGNPAVACTLLLAQAFSEWGWEMRPGVCARIDGLPLHVYEHDGASELKPCAETLLTEDAVEQIMDSGLMPLVSLKGEDAVRLVRFQAVADPLRALAGRWRR